MTMTYLPTTYLPSECVRNIREGNMFVYNTLARQISCPVCSRSFIVEFSDVNSTTSIFVIVKLSLTDSIQRVIALGMRILGMESQHVKYSQPTIECVFLLILQIV